MSKDNRLQKLEKETQPQETQEPKITVIEVYGDYGAGSVLKERHVWDNDRQKFIVEVINVEG